MFSIIHLSSYELSKSACMEWTETKRRHWKRVNADKFFQGWFKGSFSFLLSCSLLSLFLEKVEGESRGEDSFQGFLNSLKLFVKVLLHFSAPVVLTSLCTYQRPWDTSLALACRYIIEVGFILQQLLCLAEELALKLNHSPCVAEILLNPVLALRQSCGKEEECVKQEGKSRAEVFQCQWNKGGGRKKK